MYILKKYSELPKKILDTKKNKYVDKDKFYSKFCIYNTRVGTAITFKNKVPIVKQYPEAFVEVRNNE